MSTSPNSGEYDVSASEDSPMAVVEASSSASNSEDRLPSAASDILSDVEEYTLDIVAHTKKVEVKMLYVEKFYKLYSN